MKSSKKKFVLITLGEELLIGLTPNDHLAFIGAELRKRGISLHSHHTLSDKEEDIVKGFDYCWSLGDVIISTGGLGPTEDDRTKETIAKTLGERLIIDEAILMEIEKRFESLGKAMTSNNRKQALRPENAETLDNLNGTAPVLWLEKDGRILIMLPGPPSELRGMFLAQVLPRLERMGLIEDRERYLQLRTVGIGESALEARLKPFLEQYENIAVAYCAHDGQVDLRLSYIDLEHCDDSLLDLADVCRSELGSDFLCYGHDSLAMLASDILRCSERKLAIAESCTGGLLSNAFADISGASKFFLGGIVCYSNEAKVALLNVPEEMIQQHSAVSSEVAIAMAAATAEKFEADYALSVTGYAGPAGGSDANPVGTVYIGMYSPSGIWSKKVFFKGSRQAIKHRVQNAALDWLRRVLLEEPGMAPANEALREESNKILKSLS